MSDIVNDIQKAMENISNKIDKTFYFYPPSICGKTQQIHDVAKQLGLCTCCIKKCT